MKAWVLIIKIQTFLGFYQQYLWIFFKRATFSLTVVLGGVEYFPAVAGFCSENSSSEFPAAERRVSSCSRPPAAASAPDPAHLDPAPGTARSARSTWRSARPGWPGPAGAAGPMFPECNTSRRLRRASAAPPQPTADPQNPGVLGKSAWLLVSEGSPHLLQDGTFRVKGHRGVKAAF